MNLEILIKTLEAEVEVYNELVRVETDKTNIIVEGNIEKLDKIMNSEQVITMKINGLEKKRMGIMDGLGLHNKTLREVIAIAKNDGNKTRGRLFKIYKDLKESTDKIKQINEQNQILIKSRLKVITDFTDYVQSAVSPNTGNISKAGKMATYDKNAKVVQQTQQNNETTIRRKF